MLRSTKESVMVACSIMRDIDRLPLEVQVTTVCALAAMVVRKHRGADLPVDTLAWIQHTVAEWVDSPGFDRAMEAVVKGGG